MKYLSNKNGFLGIDNKVNFKEKVVVIPFGLEKTVSYGGGTKNGPKEIIKASHGNVIGKGGAEGIQCLCKVNEGIGLALKVEDGSKRAKHAVSLHLLKQLEWISDLRIQDIEEKVFNFPEGVRLEVKGKVKFQES